MRWISFVMFIVVKYLSKLFYKYKVYWYTPKNKIAWQDIRLIIFLNHTSLFEFVYLAVLPNHFLYRLSKKMVAPAADKTMDRPLVGTFFKLFNPGLIAISRKRDDTWHNFMEAIHQDAIILIAPEGRMKRVNGLDTNGYKMTVKSGIVDILKELHTGKMVFAYSGGLHHVQIPDTHKFKVFKQVAIDIELLDINTYKHSFDSQLHSDQWYAAVLNDMQSRLEQKIPSIS